MANYDLCNKIRQNLTSLPSGMHSKNGQQKRSRKIGEKLRCLYSVNGFINSLKHLKSDVTTQLFKIIGHYIQCSCNNSSCIWSLEVSPTTHLKYVYSIQHITTMSVEFLTICKSPMFISDLQYWPCSVRILTRIPKTAILNFRNSADDDDGIIYLGASTCILVMGRGWE